MTLFKWNILSILLTLTGTTNVLAVSSKTPTPENWSRTMMQRVDKVGKQLQQSLPKDPNPWATDKIIAALEKYIKEMKENVKKMTNTGKVSGNMKTVQPIIDELKSGIKQLEAHLKRQKQKRPTNKRMLLSFIDNVRSGLAAVTNGTKNFLGTAAKFGENTINVVLDVWSRAESTSAKLMDVTKAAG